MHHVCKSPSGVLNSLHCLKQQSKYSGFQFIVFISKTIQHIKCLTSKCVVKKLELSFVLTGNAISCVRLIRKWRDFWCLLFACGLFMHFSLIWSHSHYKALIHFDRGCIFLNAIMTSTEAANPHTTFIHFLLNSVFIETGQASGCRHSDPPFQNNR